MKTKKETTSHNRQEVANMLSKLLADETVLCIKTKNAHWNNEGHDFYDKHKLFEVQFTQLEEMIDSIAERIRTIGHYAPATLKNYLSLTHLSESKSEKNDGPGYIKELLGDHQSIISNLKEQVPKIYNEYNDVGSQDLIAGILCLHEKMAWFLRSHIVK